MSNYIPHKIMDTITYPCQKLNHVSKREPWVIMNLLFLTKKPGVSSWDITLVQLIPVRTRPVHLYNTIWTPVLPIRWCRSLWCVSVHRKASPKYGQYSQTNYKTAPHIHVPFITLSLFADSCVCQILINGDPLEVGDITVQRPRCLCPISD